MPRSRFAALSGITESGQPVLNRVVAEYDFGVEGGAISTIGLRGDTIPNGALLVNAYMHVDTAFTTGSGATMGISSEGASDVQAATVVSGAPYSTTGIKRLTLTSTSAGIKTTAERTISVVIAVGTVTAGRMRVILEYLLMTP